MCQWALYLSSRGECPDVVFWTRECSKVVQISDVFKVLRAKSAVVFSKRTDAEYRIILCVKKKFIFFLRFRQLEVVKDVSKKDIFVGCHDGSIIGFGFRVKNDEEF